MNRCSPQFASKPLPVDGENDTEAHVRSHDKGSLVWQDGVMNEDWAAKYEIGEDEFAAARDGDVLFFALLALAALTALALALFRLAGTGAGLGVMVLVGLAVFWLWVASIAIRLVSGILGCR